MAPFSKERINIAEKGNAEVSFFKLEISDKTESNSKTINRRMSI